LSTLGNNHLILMVGGYNSQIHVYTIGLNDSQLQFKFSMLGHFNSIKSLAISSQLGESQIRYIASASQD